MLLEFGSCFVRGLLGDELLSFPVDKLLRKFPQRQTGLKEESALSSSQARFSEYFFSTQFELKQFPRKSEKPIHYKASDETSLIIRHLGIFTLFHSLSFIT